MACGKNGGYSCICPVSFGLALGIVTGLVMLIFGWMGWLWGYGTSLIDMSATVHYGYNYTFIGGIMGGVWGLVEGFIFGFVFGWIYNFLMRRCHKKEEGSM